MEEEEEEEELQSIREKHGHPTRLSAEIPRIGILASRVPLFLLHSIPASLFLPQ